MATNTEQLLDNAYPSEYTKLGGRRVHTETVATAAVSVFSMAFCVVGLCMHAGQAYVQEKTWWMMAILGVMLVVAVACSVVIFCLPQAETEHLKFKAPGVPVMPLISVAVNIYLLFSLDKWTWVRFGVWLVFGRLCWAPVPCRASNPTPLTCRLCQGLRSTSGLASRTAGLDQQVTALHRTAIVFRLMSRRRAACLHHSSGVGATHRWKQRGCRQQQWLVAYSTTRSSRVQNERRDCVQSTTTNTICNTDNTRGAALESACLYHSSGVGATHLWKPGG